MTTGVGDQNKKSDTPITGAETARGCGCVIAAVLDLIVSFFPPFALLIYVLAHLGWLGAILRPFAAVLAVLWVLTIAGLIITTVMIRAGAGGVDAVTAFLILAAVLVFGVLPLTLLVCFGWLVNSFRARPILCAACGQATSRENARFCESCAVLGERTAPRLLYGGRLAGVAVADDGTRKGSLVIRRKPGILNAFRDWHVILDEKDVGAISRGQERRFEVAPGPHEVRLKIGSWSTNSIVFTGNEHEVFLECGRDDVETFWLVVEPTIWRMDRSFRLTRVNRHTND